MGYFTCDKANRYLQWLTYRRCSKCHFTWRTGAAPFENQKVSGLLPRARMATGQSMHWRSHTSPSAGVFDSFRPTCVLLSLTQGMRRLCWRRAKVVLLISKLIHPTVHKSPFADSIPCRFAPFSWRQYGQVIGALLGSPQLTRSKFTACPDNPHSPGTSQISTL